MHIFLKLRNIGASRARVMIIRSNLTLPCLDCISILKDRKKFVFYIEWSILKGKKDSSFFFFFVFTKSAVKKNLTTVQNN